MMSIFRKDRREDTEAEEKPLKIKVGIRVMQPQAKRLLEPQEARKDSPLEPSESMVLPTL